MLISRPALHAHLFWTLKTCHFHFYFYFREYGPFAFCMSHYYTHIIVLLFDIRKKNLCMLQTLAVVAVKVYACILSAVL